MTAQENPVTEGMVPIVTDHPALEQWCKRLLVAAVGVYSIAVVLLVAAIIPSAVSWGLLSAVAGLVTLACLAGAAQAIGSFIASLWPRSNPVDEWAGLWEKLMQRPVQ